MKTLIVVMTLLSAAQQDEKKPNRFLELNPDYRERAGGFYEKTYLPAASESLAKAAALERFTKEQAAGILKKLIYDWLDAYIAGGGAMSRATHAAVLKKADDAVRKVLDDEAAFKRWTAWRDAVGPGENPLAFLTSARMALAGLTLRLPSPFEKEGWTLRRIQEEGDLVLHTGGFSETPFQVFDFVQGDAGRLELFVFRAGRALELLAGIQKVEASEPRLFWRTLQFVVFSFEKGPVPESLKEQLRRQLLMQ